MKKEIYTMEDFYKYVDKEDQEGLISTYHDVAIDIYTDETIDGKHYKDGILIDEEWGRDILTNDIEHYGLHWVEWYPNEDIPDFPNRLVKEWIIGRTLDEMKEAGKI